jgi:hypothetical protein
MAPFGKQQGIFLPTTNPEDCAMRRMCHRFVLTGALDHADNRQSFAVLKRHPDALDFYVPLERVERNSGQRRSHFEAVKAGGHRCRFYMGQNQAPQPAPGELRPRLLLDQAVRARALARGRRRRAFCASTIHRTLQASAPLIH